MLGPLAAFALLSAGLPMGQVFLWSLVPGVLVLVLLGLGLEQMPAATPRAAVSPLRWGRLHTRVRGLIVAAGGLALASAPEAFLVLWASDRGLRLAWVPLIWAAASAVKAVVAGPTGALSDRYGRIPVLLGGWSLRILLLLALGFSGTDAGQAWIWTLFLAYAGALAATEGAERALIGDFAGAGERGTAFGLYHMTVGLAALPGALLFGGIWQLWGSTAAFFLAAGIAARSMLLLAWTVRGA